MNPIDWFTFLESIPAETRARMSEVKAAALLEIGVHAEPNSDGSARILPSSRKSPALHYKAHEISCRAICIEPLGFDDWRRVTLYQAKNKARTAQWLGLPEVES